ncbi:MAG: hypothetical protein ACKOTB_12770, partial [Planctomycetia bacterium]
MSAVTALTVLVPGLGPAAPPSSSATEPAARDVAVDVGFAGVFRTGSWTPVTVTFPSASAAAETVRVAVEDPDGQHVWSPPARVVTEPDGRRRARLVVRFGRPASGIILESAPAESGGIRGRPENTVRRSLPPPMPSSESVFLSLGDLPAAERASRLLSREDGSRPRV